MRISAVAPPNRGGHLKRLQPCVQFVGTVKPQDSPLVSPSSTTDPNQALMHPRHKKVTQSSLPLVRGYRQGNPLNRNGIPLQNEKKGSSRRNDPRSARARFAAHELHSQRDSREITAKARAAFQERFERQVDPTGALSVPERLRRAAHARKAYFTRLGYLSGKARRNAA